MGNYCGGYGPAVGLILKCHAAGWSPGKIANEIGQAVENGWLSRHGRYPGYPSKSVVSYIIFRETVSLDRQAYRRYVKRHRNHGHPIAMSGARGVWINK